MGEKHTVILVGDSQRRRALRLVTDAPAGWVVEIREPRRSLDQNAKMWAMLSDIADARPDRREHTPEVWKEIFMSALGHETRFEMGLDGKPFPAGFRSSRLTRREMADLITFIGEYGDRHGVRWTASARDQEGAQ